MADPTFLVGAERSGTTLFRLLVDSHPEVTCLENLDYAISAIGDDGTLMPLSEYDDFLVTQTVFTTAGMTVDHSLGDLAAVAKDFVEQRKAASGKDRAAVMLKENFARTRFVWPDARYVHLVRDPRAVANDSTEFEWGGNPWNAIRKWIAAEQEWDRLRPHLSDDRFIEIRFEDLVTEPEATLTRVCDFLGVAYDAEMYSYASETDYERPLPSEADRWRDELTDRQIQHVEARVGALLTDRGYAPSGLDRHDPGAVEKFLLEADVRQKKWRHKLLLHGPAGIAELFFRKARIGPAQRYFKLKMNADERGSRKRSWRAEGREYALAPHKAAEDGAN